MIEKWRTINGFPEYAVSNHGRVIRKKTGRVLRQAINPNGYCIVCLSQNCFKTTVYVHRLVLEHFAEKKPGKTECNHKTGIKSDNRIDQLEWVSRSENMRHAIENGLIRVQGEQSPVSKLTEQDVLKIRELVKNRIPQWQIAELFQISAGHVSKIHNRERWAHI